MITFTIRAAGQTCQGSGRASNEDRFAIDACGQLFVVADGMGGEGFGDVAAQLAVDLLPRRIRSALNDLGKPDRAVQGAMTEAHQGVWALNAEGRRRGAAVALAFWFGDQVFITWIGDCRAYLVSVGKAQQLTEDHDIRTALIRNGTLTAEQAETQHIRNVLYRYLGVAELEGPFELVSFRPQLGSRLILASDGLGRLKEDVLLPICHDHPDPYECAARLIQTAVERGTRDDATCIVAAFDPILVQPSWLAANDAAAVKLAHAIHHDSLFQHLPILADALEDAGCAEAALLDHLRSPGPHGRGCWVLDLLRRSVSEP